MFIDAIMVKVRDGRSANRPVYAAIGVDLDGHKDILGMRAGDGDGESAKSWFAALTELRNRGVRDVFLIVCDGLKGLPERVSAVFPLATVQVCIIHLIRGSFRSASRKYRESIAKDLRPVYQAVNAAAADAALAELEAKWGSRPSDDRAAAQTPGRSSPRGTGQSRWITRWKPALNAFAITYADRMPAAEDR